MERDPAVQLDAEPRRARRVSYLTAPLSANTAIVGGGAAQLWVKSSTPDVDLQVTVTEVRPDGKETFVQSGWLRASERKLDPARSTLLAPYPTFRRADVSPLPKGSFTEVTVPLYYEGHVVPRRLADPRDHLRAQRRSADLVVREHRLRRGQATVAIAHSPQMPSRLVLPLVPGVQRADRAAAVSRACAASRAARTSDGGRGR